MITQRWWITGSAVLVVLGACMGEAKPMRTGWTLLKASSVAVNDQSAQVTGATDPPVPPLHAPSVENTTLPQRVVRDDVAFLGQLFKQHPGDGVLRGPDQLVYNIDARIDAATHQVGGHLDLHLRNNLGKPMPVVYFNVWPNAPHYRKDGGYEAVSNVRLNGVPQPFSQSGSVLRVSLREPVAQGCDCTVSLDFAVALPRNLDRFGWQGTTVNLGNWYPILAVHDDYGWVTPPYYPDGESFYSLTGAYHVNVTAPVDTVVAATGCETAQHDHAGGTRTHTFVSRGVRDVAIVADPNWKVLRTRVGSTEVVTYYRPDLSSQSQQAQLMSDTAKAALRAYGQLYGAYPYQTLRVCAMEGWFGGMEYPQLVMISFPKRGNSRPQTQTFVAHEVAHQWFYGMLGDNEYLTPWLDESFSQFSEMRMYNQLPRLDRVRFSGRPSYGMSAFPSSDFKTTPPGDPNLYFTTVYLGGAKSLNALRQQLGDGAFDAMMKAYVQQFQYQVATTRDFIAAASKAKGANVGEFFRQQLLVDPNDDHQSPTLDWVRVETTANGRDWHGEQ